MSEHQKDPLKLYVQDIYRAKQTPENKYIYEIFGTTFKNVMIHGIVMLVYNKTEYSTNLEVCDATGSVNVYYDTKKNNSNLNSSCVQDLFRNYADLAKFGDSNAHIMSKLLDRISESRQSVLNFEEGSYVSVIGDIFVDDLQNIRMISAYECKQSSIERDLVWLEELRYLYEKFYLWNKE